MAGIAQRDDGKPGGLGLRDAEVHGDGRDGLAKPDIAVDHRVVRRLHHDRGLLAGLHLALAEPLYVARNPDHAVAVVTGQVGADQPMGNARGFGAVAPGGGEDGGDVGLQRVDGNNGVGGGHYAGIYAIALAVER